MKEYECIFLGKDRIAVKIETIRAKSILDLLIEMNRRASEYGLSAGSYKQI